MAIDEFLFHSLPEKEPQTTVRFYEWDKPTVSIGVSQEIDRVVNVQACREQGIDIVRRMTGGKLVLHADEVTYSVCSSDTSAFTANLDGSYKRISEALVCGLKEMGLTPQLAGSTSEGYARSHLPCFSQLARNEIEIESKKITGSAQKRKGIHFIQHGSIPLKNQGELLKKVSISSHPSHEIQAISLDQALKKDISFTWVVEKLILGFKRYFFIDFKNDNLSEQEKRIILSIQKEKFENPLWTLSSK